MNLLSLPVVSIVWALAAPHPTLPALVERYRSGERDAAVHEVAAWSRDRLRQQTGRIEWRLKRREDLGVPLTGVIMLHTDAAVFSRANHRPFASDLQVAAARALVRLLPADPADASFARRWYLALASYDQGLWDGDRARDLLEEGRQRFPRDAEMLVALGSVYEMEGSLPPPAPPAAGVARPGGIVARTYAATVRDRREALEKAEEAYRQALSLDPALTEGRLRHGSVLCRLGRGDEALAELARALEGAVDERTRYLAHLFTGHELEAAGRLDDAAQEYRASIEAEPRCQAGRLALAHVLDRLRSRESAAELLEEAVAPDDDAGGRQDPWWTYPFGEAARAESLLDALRQEALR
jgi:tetratricopeptide (TPR) repeat protein